jgi:hypothetical protein
MRVLDGCEGTGGHCSEISWEGKPDCDVVSRITCKNVV